MPEKATHRHPREETNWQFGPSCEPSNENKMSDGGRRCASLGMFVCRSCHEWSAQRSGVRSIAWLDVRGIRWRRGVKALAHKWKLQNSTKNQGRQRETHLASAADDPVDNAKIAAQLYVNLLEIFHEQTNTHR